MNNEEKILALLERMDGRLDSMDGRLDSMGGRLDSMDGRLDTLEQGQKELRTHVSALETEFDTMKLNYYSMRDDLKTTKLAVLNIEHKHVPEIKAALDGFASVKEKNQELDQRLRGAEARIEIQGIEISKLKMAH